MRCMPMETSRQEASVCWRLRQSCKDQGVSRQKVQVRQLLSLPAASSGR